MLGELSTAGAALAAVLCGVLGLLVPRLIASIPEPPASTTEAGSDAATGSEADAGSDASARSDAEADPGLGPVPEEDGAPEAEPAGQVVTKTPYARIGARPGLQWQSAVISAFGGALVGGAVGLDWALLFLVPLVPVGVALAVVDWQTCLLPTRVLAPTYLALIPLVVVAALASGEPGLLLGAAIGWAVMGGIYLVLHLVHPAGMGYGDVRLSGILGIVLGYLGLGELVLGAWSAFLLGGLGGVVLVLLRVIDRRSNPFGPWMLIGALVGIVAGPAFAVWMWGDLAA